MAQQQSTSAAERTPVQRSLHCLDCQTKFTLFNRQKSCPKASGGCGKALCGKCLSFPLVTEGSASKGRVQDITTLCKDCFKSHSSLPFKATEDILGPVAGEAISLVYVHGGGSCRLMFRQHAEAMASKGFRCILLDLPGHGARMDEPLTLESSIQVIVQTIRNHTATFNTIKPIYIGGSLGGYIGMEFLGLYPDLVSAAIITVCGQNVGVGRGWAAGLGLAAFKCFIPRLSTATLLKGLVGEAKKNGHIPDAVLLEIALRPGMYFGQGLQQVEILCNSNPRASLDKFQGPILFINGSKDHRDSEDVWKETAKQGELIVYEGADHFLSHDTRYSTRFLDDCFIFIDRLLKKQGGRTGSQEA